MTQRWPALTELALAESNTDQSRPLPWQAHNWREFGALQEKSRLGHAILLEGRSGTGRNAFALALARQLLCQNSSPEGNCGTCKACQLSKGGAHPDFHRVVPAEPGKSIGIDQIRAAIVFASRTPTLGRQKVLLCSPAEVMTIAAYNAFLKCLEEPQGETVIIMVSAVGHPIPATVRSRCQRYTLPLPDAETSRQWLATSLAQSEQVVDPELLLEVLALTDDRPLQALQLLTENDAALLGLNRALRHAAGQGISGQLALEQAAAAVNPVTLLGVFETAIQRWLKQQPAGVLRSDRGRQGFTSLQRLAKLRAACRAGSNPNAELLRFQALQTCTVLLTD